MNATKKVFISYAKEDFGIAKKLYYDLKLKGVNPWMDSEDILPGQNWRNEIANAIKNCSFFITMLSSISVSKKGYVQKEQTLALDFLDEFPVGEVYIIPVRLDACEPIHPKLKDLQWVDLFQSYKNGVEKILKVIAPVPREMPDELETFIVDLISKKEIDLSSFEKRASWGERFSLLHKEFDGDEYLYIFWDNTEKRLSKTYRSHNGRTWYKGYKLNYEDKQKVRKALGIK